MDWRNSLSLVAIILMLGTLAYLYGSGNVSEHMELTSNNADVADYMATSTQSISTDDHGKVDRRVTSDALRHYMQPAEQTRMEHPHVIILTEGKPVWGLKAQHGISMESNAHIVLNDDVVADHLIPDPHQHLHLQTTTLDAFPDLQAIQTNAHVFINSAQGQTEADGMDASLRTGILHLHQHVHGTYVFAHETL